MPNLSWTIGDARITRVVELEAKLPMEEFLPQATAAALEPHVEWLRPHFLDEAGNLTLSIHSLLVESCGQLIIVDTCVGEKPIPGFEALTPETFDFPDRLADAGFPRENVDTVLCTHLHFDHVGWNTMRVGDRWVPTFPKARYLFARAEWDYWRNEEERPFTSTLGDTVSCIIDAGLADLVETDHKLTDEVRLEATPGHTPGHVSVHIESAGTARHDHGRHDPPSRAVGGARLGDLCGRESRARGRDAPAPDPRARRQLTPRDRHPLPDPHSRPSHAARRGLSFLGVAESQLTQAS